MSYFQDSIKSVMEWNKETEEMFVLFVVVKTGMKFTTFSSFAKIDSLNHARIRAKSF